MTVIEADTAPNRASSGNVIRRFFQSPHAAHRRSLLKAISWRFFGSLDTFLLATLISGHAHTGAAIAGTEFLTKIFLYYLHERGWARIRWGLKDGAH